MTLPIPEHLEKKLSVDYKKSEEKQLYASLNCCNNDEFQVHISQNDLVCVVKAICIKCKQEIIVFDNRLHGWDGYVCHLFKDEQANPFKTVNCKNENENIFCIHIRIYSQGKEDFIREACSEVNEETQKQFDETEWRNAFEEIDIDLLCNKCKKIKKLISYETM